jgi:hypothetical protein
MLQDLCLLVTPEHSHSRDCQCGLGFVRPDAAKQVSQCKLTLLSAQMAIACRSSGLYGTRTNSIAGTLNTQHLHVPYAMKAALSSLAIATHQVASSQHTRVPPMAPVTAHYRRVIVTALVSTVTEGLALAQRERRCLTTPALQRKLIMCKPVLTLASSVKRVSSDV